jgi:hypothetical protein
VPILSRASALTAATARNSFFFLCFATLIESLAQVALISLDPTGCGIIETTGDERMEERDFFDERAEKKSATLNCPHCHQSAEYEVTWLVRTKKRQIPRHADDRDRARFAKAKSYMLRRDDVMGCKNVRCRKRFEISGLQSVVFTD